MPIIRITKEFRFEGAHALTGYDGKCRHIHGHSYIMYVTVKGEPVNDETSPKNGMLIDFSVLKRTVNEHIIDKFDHALLMKKGTPLSEEISSEYGNVIITDFQPTCENLVSYMAGLISSRLPEGISLCSIRLYETASSFAEWRAEDNI